MLTVDFTDEEVKWMTSPTKETREFFQMLVLGRISIDARHTTLRENSVPANDEYFGEDDRA